MCVCCNKQSVCGFVLVMLFLYLCVFTAVDMDFVCAALPAGRIVIATTAITVTVGKKTAIAGGRMSCFVSSLYM